MDTIVSIQMANNVRRMLSTNASAQTLLAETDPQIVAQACELSQGFLDHAARGCVAHILAQVKTLAQQAAAKRREKQFKAAFKDDLSQHLSAPTCPITHQDFTDAVVAADGIVYEHAALQQWISVANDDGNVRSPSTNAPMSSSFVQSVAVQKMANDITFLKNEAANHAWACHKARETFNHNVSAAAALRRQPRRESTDRCEC